MKLNSLTKRKIRAGLIHLLDTEGALDRASLLRRACEAAGLTKKEEADLSLDSKYNAMRAFAGAALDRLKTGDRCQKFFLTAATDTGDP